jgi:hypothetical protein
MTWKKPTIEHIDNQFAAEGYVLHSKKYVNNRSKLEYTCPNGHVYFTSWASWVNGGRCGVCAGNVRLGLQFVKDVFASEGYELLETSYYNAHTKMNYICSAGHRHRIDWAHWKKGKRCPVCALINQSGPNHYAWKGGVSFQPYCEAWKDSEYKDSIKIRDGNECLNPYCDSKNPNDLTIHHIDYNKKNCQPNNLITICRSCNTKANKDRKWHKHWYYAIMYMRYS